MAQRHPHDALRANPNGTALPTRRPPRQSQRHSATQSQRHSATHTMLSPPLTAAQRRHTPTRQPRYRPIVRAQRIGHIANVTCAVVRGRARSCAVGRGRARYHFQSRTNTVPPPPLKNKNPSLRSRGTHTHTHPRTRAHTHTQFAGLGGHAGGSKRGGGAASPMCHLHARREFGMCVETTPWRCEVPQSRSTLSFNDCHTKRRRMGQANRSPPRTRTQTDDRKNELTF